MHARELIELAAIVAAHGPTLVRGVERLSERGLEEYWAASKIRLDRWAFAMRAFNDQSGNVNYYRAQWPHIRSTLEEVLSGETLTRVWAAVLCAHDRFHNLAESAPIARSVMLGHQEARNRTLTFLLRSFGYNAEAAVQLNTLRRRVERWTDLLIGYIAGEHDIEEFAFEPSRARDFAEELHFQSGHSGGRHAWPLVLVSLRAAFKQGLSPRSPNEDLNSRIACSVLSCFQSELFDSTGMFRSLWQVRMRNKVSDVQGLLGEVLGDSPSARTAAASRSVAPEAARRRFRA